MTNNELSTLGQAARKASFALMSLRRPQKDALLTSIINGIGAAEAEILAANGQDLADARDAGLDDAMLDRLLLTPQRLAAICADIQTVIGLADPVGEDIDSKLLDNGMRLSRRRIPLGVVGVIYEARPNVTIDIAVLALKTGNAAILRGGKETRRSNLALVAVIHRALAEHGLPEAAIGLIDNPDRALVTQLLKLDRYVDMIIPRGGAGLHQLCKEQATIPVITGGIGICHLYVDASADLDKALAVIENAKVQRPTVCNALDTLLVNAEVADALLPALQARLAPQQVTLLGCERSRGLIEVAPAGDGDFDREWLSLTLGIKVVDDVEQAIDHIRAHSSDHSESILTADMAVAHYFAASINSAAVYINASTRFTDGSQFGLGAEVAVSTQKLHARGPMGLEALTTYKWLGVGDYTVRQ
ncbi:glutamate-5-semialdehyde dehydrogenase [Ferrimonas sp. SCSIO 43195]|uniref:glutamate-5-semialdehyde dehydrogenase n=1 Tax=Ferrimonas sp. SCSIO 43195 TaxID=2822844 RepID=UPI0020765CB4|nr:glutamate-5-semialdehyde dehydrogenase [Ferrimonas sp. SCSIO 43195]USD36818.1 glutamate-5-semialdehyde dehydrogenase [Ferrimonas sp. SCSIO 43195]